MDDFVWSEEYATGIARFDNEHKVLLHMIKKISSDADHPEWLQKQLIPTLLLDLFESARMHFTSEEQFMTQHAYPETLHAEHARKHDALHRELDDFIANYRNYSGKFNDELLMYLRHWLIWHIIVEDRKLGEYFKDHGDIT